MTKLNISLFNKKVNEWYMYASDISFGGVVHFGFSTDSFAETMDLVKSVMTAYEYYLEFDAVISFDEFVAYVDCVHGCSAYFGQDVSEEMFQEWANKTINENEE